MQVITSPLLSACRQSVFVVISLKKVALDMGANWSNFAEVRKVGEGNQEGFDDF